jgi:hypothetical protein
LSGNWSRKDANASTSYQASLADERRRIDGLYTDLADVRTAAMISGADAAALRTRLALLTDRRPWWRRWFR